MLEEASMSGFKGIAFALAARVLAVTVMATIPLYAQAAGPPASERTGSIAARASGLNAQAALRSVNTYRESLGLSPVQLDAKVMAAAASHSQAMAAANSMSHDVGGGFSGRLAAHGIGRGKAVENIAMGQRSFEETFEAWKGSWGHDANLRASGVTKLGVGMAKGPSGPAWTLILVGDGFGW
jgi:uncharacterized protein YkwD